jgi:hypothetical protein
MIMNDLVKPSQTKSNPDMPTHRADAFGLPDVADAGREARPAAREGACAPRNQPVGLRFEPKQDYPNGDAYVIPSAEIAPGRANQTKSNQIKPNQTCGTPKSPKFEVHGSKFNVQNTTIRGEGKTRITTHLGKVHLCSGDLDYYYERRNSGCRLVKPGQIRLTANGRQWTPMIQATTQSNPVKPVKPKSNRINSPAGGGSGQWLVAGAAGPLCCPIKTRSNQNWRWQGKRM